MNRTLTSVLFLTMAVLLVFSVSQCNQAKEPDRTMVIERKA